MKTNKRDNFKTLNDLSKRLEKIIEIGVNNPTLLTAFETEINEIYTKGNEVLAEYNIKLDRKVALETVTNPLQKAIVANEFLKEGIKVIQSLLERMFCFLFGCKSKSGGASGKKYIQKLEEKTEKFLKESNKVFDDITASIKDKITDESLLAELKEIEKEVLMPLFNAYSITLYSNEILKIEDISLFFIEISEWFDSISYDYKKREFIFKKTPEDFKGIHTSDKLFFTLDKIMELKDDGVLVTRKYQTRNVMDLGFEPVFIKYFLKGLIETNTIQYNKISKLIKSEKERLKISEDDSENVEKLKEITMLSQILNTIRKEGDEFHKLGGEVLSKLERKVTKAISRNSKVKKVQGV